MNKPLSILDPNFKYTPSSKTDITKTFAKARKELKNSTTIQDKNKPLVNQKEPLVKNPALLQNGFVLSEDWFEVLEG